MSAFTTQRKLLFILILLILCSLPSLSFSGTVYTIQAGLFRSKKNAEKHAGAIRHLDPSIDTYIVLKKKRFLVKAGRFETKRDAIKKLKVIKKIVKDAYIEAIEEGLLPQATRGSEEKSAKPPAIKPSLKEYLEHIASLTINNRLDEALSYIDSALSEFPESHELHGWRGTVLLKKGSPSEALIWFRKAVYLKNDVPEYHNGKGYSLLATGRLYEALDEFGIALKLNPEYADALAGAGYTYVGLGMKDEAISVYNRLKKINPEMGDLLFRQIILMK